MRADSPRTEELCHLDAEEVFDRLGSRDSGLTAAEAERRLRAEGPNRLPQQGSTPLVRQLAGQFVHFFALLLWVAALLAWLAGTPQLSLAIAIVVVVNGLFSFAQEFRADRLTRSLGALLPPTATVLRDGRRTVPAEGVVRGDVLLLRAGDRVPADARLVEAERLEVDLAMLTGESEPLARAPPPSAAPPSLADAPNLVLAGTFVVAGSGRAVVFATGRDTVLAGLTRSAQKVTRHKTPLRLELAQAVRVIAAAALSVGLVFFAVSIALGRSWHGALVFGVGVIVALVPEGLLPTLTLSLALSAGRMARRRALVKRLEAVETLGAVTVICSDKTGTLTRHEPAVSVLVVDGHRVDARSLHEAGEALPLVRRAARIAALCANATVDERGAHGDPTEAALRMFAGKAGVSWQDEERAAPRVREFPFEASRRLMSTVHRGGGRYEIACKGAPEAVLARRSGSSDDSELLETCDRLATEGLRVLALAHRFSDVLPRTADEAEAGLELVGLVGIADPVREDVPQSLAACRRAGIRVLMVTGDHPGTAAAVARAAGLSFHAVVVGTDLPADDEQLADLLSARPLLARVAPADKLRIARALQSRGEVVAMTGDGVNDAPALRQADVGIAMGASGTDVAREAADMVLLDDHFANIVAAVEEGRAAFANIRRFLTYHLTDNVSELAPFIAWALTAGAFPLAIGVLQVLALDIGTDLLPALALGAEAPAPGSMQEAPRARGQRLLDRAVLVRAFGFLGPIQALLSLSLLPIGAALFFGWRPFAPLPHDPARLATLSGCVFSAIVLAQLVNAFECRDPVRPLLRRGLFGNRLLDGAVVVELLLLLLFLFVPSIARALGHAPPPLAGWGLALAAAVLFGAAEEARKRLRIARRPPVPPPLRTPLPEAGERRSPPFPGSAPPRRPPEGPGIHP